MTRRNTDPNQGSPSVPFEYKKTSLGVAFASQIFPRRVNDLSEMDTPIIEAPWKKSVPTAKPYTRGIIRRRIRANWPSLSECRHRGWRVVRQVYLRKINGKNTSVSRPIQDLSRCRTRDVGRIAALKLAGSCNGKRKWSGASATRGLSLASGQAASAEIISGFVRSATIRPV